LINRFNGTEAIKNANERVQALVDILTELPPYNVAVIYKLFTFLNFVVKHENVNKMGISNLSIIFLPSLEIGNGVFAFLVANYEDIFSKAMAKYPSATVNVSPTQQKNENINSSSQQKKK